MTENFTTVNPIIARIYNQKDRIIGTGFLISPHRLLTCAHVVIQALGIEKTTEIPQDPIKFDFPRYLALTAKVILWQPCSSSEIENAQYGEDIAVLEIIEPRSFAETVLNLLSIDTNEKQQINIFGFPEGYNNGVWTENKFRDLIFNGWLQMDQIKLSDRIIEGGFSGAPVWDKDKKTIIGMVTASDLGNQENKTATAFAIPSSVLIDTCLKFLELQDILLELDLKTVKNAYKECRKKDLDKSIPGTIQEIIRSFANEAKFKLPKEKTSLDFNLFILHLIIKFKDRKLSEYNSVIENIQEWARKYNISLENLEKKMPLQKNLSYLMIRFQKNKQFKDNYQISAVFIPDKHQYNVMENKGIIPLEEIMSLVNNEKGLIWTEIDKILPTILNNLINESKKYKPSTESEIEIIFFLPYALFDKPLETFILKDEDENEDESDLPVPLRIRHRVIFRSERRLRERYKNNYQEKWEKKWNKLLSDSQKSCESCFKLDVNTWEVLFDESEDQIIGCTIAQNPSLNICKAIDENGLPIAIWVKQILENFDYQQELNDLLKCSIGELPEKIQQKHKQGFAQCPKQPEKSLGHHLALLWEDPSLSIAHINYSTS